MAESARVKHLSQREVAERWGISHRTLERWRWVGEGPPYLKFGGRVAYRLEDIERYEQDNLRQATDAGAAVGRGARAGGRAA